MYGCVGWMVCVRVCRIASVCVWCRMDGVCLGL